VIAAHDSALGRRAAIELLRDDLAADPTVRERLLREARAGGQLHPPNGVAFWMVGEDDGTPYIVMELVEDRTLAEELRAHGSIHPLRTGQPTERTRRLSRPAVAAPRCTCARGGGRLR
jgi:serine/threonine protein kinase